VGAKAIRSLLVAASVVGAALLVYTLIASATPAPAAAARAKPQVRRISPSVVEQFYLRGTRGFHLGVRLVDRRQLTLTAGSFHGLFSLRGVTYKLRARQPRGSDAIDARIGSLGRVEARFAPESVKRKAAPSQCEGGATVTEEGHFIGRIVFRGEGDYTQVRTSSAPGTMVTQPALVCRRSGSPHPSSKHPTKRGRIEDAATIARSHKEAAEEEFGLVELRAHARHGKVKFKATRLSGRAPGKKEEGLINFTAEAHRRRGRIDEQSFAGAVLVTKLATFGVSDPEDPTAKMDLAPPWPFEGTATFRRSSPHSTSWSGDLRTELPGFGEVRFAAPGIRVSVCQLDGCPKKRP
jgi:hypothetical protein